jgi:hypothetical protein
MNKIIEEYYPHFLKREFWIGITMATCVNCFIVLPQLMPEYRYEQYAMFLTMSGLYMLIVWWIPIYLRRKNE